MSQPRLKPIISNKIFERVHIDLIDMGCKPDGVSALEINDEVVPVLQPEIIEPILDVAAHQAIVNQDDSDATEND